MDFQKKINITVSFDSEGPIQETSGSYQSEGALPGPPEAGGSIYGQSWSGLGMSLPPPPGYSSEDKSRAGSDENDSKGEPPPPPGSGNKERAGTQDMGPPDPSENVGNTYGSPSPPAEKDSSLKSKSKR